MSKNVEAILTRYQHRRERLIDMLLAIQDADGYISDSSVHVLANGLNLSPLDVRETLLFITSFTMNLPESTKSIWPIPS